MTLFMIFILLLVALIAVSTLTFFWIKRRKYTRERFAFAAMTALLTLSMAAIVCFAASTTVWDAAIIVSGQILGEPVSPPEPRTTDHILSFAVLLLFGWFASSLHRRWDGALSAEGFARRYDDIRMREEAAREALRILHRTPPPAPYQPHPTSRITPALPATAEISAWHEQARMLVQIRYSHLYFEATNGWYDSVRAWVGINRDSGGTAILGCFRQPPSDSELGHWLGDLRRTVSQIDQAEISIVSLEGNLEYDRILEKSPIRELTRASLLDSLVDFSDYFSDLRRRAEIDHLPDSDIALSDTYVRSAAIVESTAKYLDDAQTYMELWLDETSDRHLALLGEYGQGKSSLALMLAHTLAQRFKPGARVPILIELRGTSPRNLRPDELIILWAGRYGYRSDAIMSLVSSGRAVLILEGFDEMELIGTPQTRLDHFRTLWGLCYPKGKLLITGRPNFFLDDEELKGALAISESTATGPYSEAIRLLPFDTQRIGQALRCAPASTRDEIVDLASRNKGALEIVSRPSLLYIVGQLWGGLRHYRNNMSSAKVISRFINYSYSRQAQKSRQTGKFMVLNTPERSFFMSGVAAHMASAGLPNQIDRRELTTAVEDLYAHFPEVISTQGSAPSDEPSDPLASRLRGLEDPLDSVRADIAACGILVTDPSRPNKFRFAHKSFMEYLLAEVIANRLSGEGDSRTAADAICAATGLDADHVMRFEESMSFLAEILTDHLSIEYAAESMASQLYEVLVARQMGRISCFISLFCCRVNGTRGGTLLFIMFSTLLLSMTLIHDWLMPYGWWGSVLLTAAAVVCGILLCLMPPYSRILLRKQLTRLLLWERCCNALALDPASVIGRIAVRGLKPGWLFFGSSLAGSAGPLEHVKTVQQA